MWENVCCFKLKSSPEWMSFLLASSVWQLCDGPAAAQFLCACTRMRMCLRVRVGSSCRGLYECYPRLFKRGPSGLTAVFVHFWRRKGRAIWSWCRRNTLWWLAPIPVTSASITTSCFTAPSTDCWAPARASCLSLWVCKHVRHHTKKEYKYPFNLVLKISQDGPC